MSTTATDYKCFIGGESVDAASGETMDVVNPATGEVDRRRAALRQGGRRPRRRGREEGARRLARR